MDRKLSISRHELWKTFPHTRNVEMQAVSCLLYIAIHLLFQNLNYINKYLQVFDIAAPNRAISDDQRPWSLSGESLYKS